MADQHDPNHAPSSPNINGTSRYGLNDSEPAGNEQAGVSHVNETEPEQSGYVYQLEEELQELRRVVGELQQRQTRSSQIPATTTEPTLPPHSMPSMVSQPFTSMPPFTTQPVYYPYPPNVPYPYPISQISPQPEPKKKCTFKQFTDCKVREFAGSSDPNVTMNWIREVVRAFKACQCEEDQKVSFATQLLKDEAMVWWDSITGHMSQAQVDSITWEQFQNKVCEKYCTLYDVGKIRREFLGLVMTDDTSVEEYMNQFNLKLRFVHNMFPDEVSQIDRFVEGLIPEYRSAVQPAVSLSHAFVLAKQAEDDVKARTKMNQEKASLQKSKFIQPSSGQKNKNQNDSSRKQFIVGGTGQRSSNRCATCRSFHTGQCSTKTNRCIRCGVIGHFPKDCSYPNEVCWNCHKEGHRSGLCPEAKRYSLGVGGGSSATRQKRKNPPTAEGRAFQMTVDEATANPDVITGDKGKGKAQ